MCVRARNVPTCLCPSCGNFIILSWNTCLRLTPSPTFLLFDSTNMFSRSRYTPAFLSVLSCQSSLSATVLFLLLPPFFQRRCAVSRSIPLSFSLSSALAYVYIFSQTYLRFFSRTHTLLSQPLRLLPFSIFECSVIIIILTCVRGVGAASLL